MLTDTDELIFCVLASDAALLNQSGGQTALKGAASNGQVLLAANTTYFFEAQYLLTSTGTDSHTWAAGFSCSPAPAGISFLLRAHQTTGANVLGDTKGIFSTTHTGGGQVVTAASTSATEHVAITASGVIRVNNVAITVTPEINLSNAPGVAPTILAGSFFRATPIGNNTVRTAGAWQ
mgnify:CR=1 FL=1